MYHIELSRIHDGGQCFSFFCRTGWTDSTLPSVPCGKHDDFSSTIKNYLFLDNDILIFVHLFSLFHNPFDMHRLIPLINVLLWVPQHLHRLFNGTLDIVIEEIISSIQRPCQTIWIPPSSKCEWHSCPWQHAHKLYVKTYPNLTRHYSWYCYRTRFFYRISRAFNRTSGSAMACHESGQSRGYVQFWDLHNYNQTNISAKNFDLFVSPEIA